jgi:hypothetical protein
MIREAYEGEKELASEPGQRAKLREMLGLAPAITSKTAPQTEESASERKTTQQGQVDEFAKGDEQELLPAEIPADAALSTLQSVSGDQSNETTNRAEEVSEARETPSSEAPPKPLKKPKAETTRPFRRKETRDRTGGPRRKNGE